MPPDAEMVRGRPAIEKLWADALASGIKTIAFTVVDVQSSGEFAVETGRAVLGVQPAGQPRNVANRKLIVVWQRGVDGQWQLLRDIWNGTPLPSREVLPVLWVPKVPRVVLFRCSVLGSRAGVVLFLTRPPSAPPVAPPPGPPGALCAHSP